MTTVKNKSIEHLRRKSTDHLFRPIVSANDLNNQRKPPSPFQTGLRYLKFLGQIKRQNENPKSSILQRTSAFSTNYYASLPSVLNKSIQVDDLDDLSYKTAIIHKNNFYEFFFYLISLSLFILIIFLIKFNSHPLHCLLHKKFWYPYDFSQGFLCENTNIQIHYLEIYSEIYQIEIERNFKAMNCLGFNILSCLPIDYLSVPKQQIIRRNNEFSKYCNSTKKFTHQNQSLTILPNEYKWSLRNNDIYQLKHCSNFKNLNQTKCFHFMINNQCDLQIPWIDYCLKYSKTQLICQAYIHH